MLYEITVKVPKEKEEEIEEVLYQLLSQGWGHLSRELCLLIKSLYKHLPQFV
ncbi:MAG: hypothetical protein XD67_0539 [Thermodesulfobacterium commune]|nr:MAG: hypothetical protein XD67_0539 [Thermodesulfobacterium commune]